MSDESVVPGSPSATPGSPAVVTPPSSATPPASSTPAPAPAASSVEDPRIKGMLADLAKERKERQRLNDLHTSTAAELAAERRRVAALAGVSVSSPQEAEAEEIRQRFSQVITPDYLLKQMGLSKEEIAEFKEMRAERKQVSEATNHVWAQHGQQMINAATSEIQKAYGGQDLTPRQIQGITKAYVLKAQSDPEFLSRHEQGDKALIKEFAQEWVEDWFEPARRQAVKNELGQFRPVPNGKDRHIVNQGERKIDVNDPKAVEDALVAGFRERGGQFGRRG